MGGRFRRSAGRFPVQQAPASAHHQRLLQAPPSPSHIDPKTVAETAVGAVEGERFDPEKGEQVRVTATLADGSPEALFIRTN